MTSSSNDSKCEPENGGEENATGSRLRALDDTIVKPGNVIRADLLVRDQNGLDVEPDQKSIDLLIGSGQLLPQIEAALIGLRQGERRSIRLHPNEAYGERDETKIVEFDRDEFPADISAGDHFEAERDEGGIVVLRIIEVRSDAVKVDMNHPLAGQSVELEFCVKCIRSATRQELEVANAWQERQNFGVQGELMPVGRLLRGRPGR
jgi:FKBP-type peptidyl-prolyl cis-trans isomerase SlyD